MNREQIIKAWKDDEYRDGLSEGERALLPEHPAGLIELSDAQLGVAGGEERTWRADTFGCCAGPTKNPQFCQNTHYLATFGCCQEIAPNIPG